MDGSRINEEFNNNNQDIPSNYDYTKEIDDYKSLSLLQKKNHTR